MSDQGNQPAFKDLPRGNAKSAKPQATGKQRSPFAAGAWLAFLFACGFFGYYAMTAKPVSQKTFFQQQAEQSVKQLAIVIKSNDPDAIAAQASMCAHWYLQAGDEENYLQFKELSDSARKLSMQKTMQETSRDLLR